MRASGKTSVKHGTTFDFVIALVVGDMIDDAIWVEVGMAQFLTGIVSLFAAHWSARYAGYRAA